MSRTKYEDLAARAKTRSSSRKQIGVVKSHLAQHLDIESSRFRATKITLLDSGPLVSLAIFEIDSGHGDTFWDTKTRVLNKDFGKYEDLAVRAKQKSSAVRPGKQIGVVKLQFFLIFGF